MGRTACTEPQCLYKGALYLYWEKQRYAECRLRFKPGASVVQIEIVHFFMEFDAAINLQTFQRNLMPSSSLSLLKKEALTFSKMVVSFHPSIRRHISEDGSKKQSGIRIPWNFINDSMLLPSAMLGSSFSISTSSQICVSETVRSVLQVTENEILRD